MVAILEVGAFISSLMVGRIGDIIGRRKTIFYGSCVFVVGGALQTFAKDMAMMMTGRVLAGLGVGMLSTIVPVYQSEISPPHNRGQLACIEFTGNIIGYATSVWVDYFCGFIKSNLSWRLPLLMQCVMGALLGLGSLIIVESPRYVARYSKSARVLTSLEDGYLTTIMTRRALWSLPTSTAAVISTIRVPGTSSVRSR
jgi:MFS family permease